MRSANTPETEKTQVISNTYNIYTVDGTLVYAVNEQVLKDAKAHLQLAIEEWSYYRMIIDTAKEVLKNTFTDDGQLIVPPVNACVPSRNQDITMHFSLDMAQQVRTCTCTVYINNYTSLYDRQVHYPSGPQQPGPMYFLTPRKCAIFGICCEAIPRQVGFN